MKINRFFFEFKRYLILKLFNNFILLNNFFLGINTITFGLFKYRIFNYLNKIYFKILDNYLIFFIEKEISYLTIQLHPLDIFTIYMDSKKNIGGPDNLKKIISSQTLENNLKEISSFSESINSLGKKYPIFIENVFFILLVKNDKNTDLLKKDRIDGYFANIISYKIKLIFDNLELLLERLYSISGLLLHWDVILSKVNLTNYFEYKKDFLMFFRGERVKSFDDYKIFFEILENNYKTFNILDFDLHFYEIRNLIRLKFMLDKGIVDESFKKFYKYFIDFHTLINLSPLNYSIFIPKNNHNNVKYIKEIINFLGYKKYIEFRQEIINYFNKNKKNGLTKPLLSSEYINNIGLIKFMDDSNNEGYFFLPKGFISYFTHKIRDKISAGKFGKFFEKYCYFYVSYQLKSINLESDKYIIKSGIKLRQKGKDLGDIDLLIYNKEDKSLVIFEIKYINILNSFRKNMKELLGNNGELLKPIKQLVNISNNIRLLEKKLNIKIDENKIQYVIINSGKSKLWNSIIRDFIEISKSDVTIFDNFIYTFMNINEFEDFIYICSKLNIDFYTMLYWKTKLMYHFPHTLFLQEYELNPKIVTDIDGMERGNFTYIEEDMFIFLKYFKGQIENFDPFYDIELFE